MIAKDSATKLVAAGRALYVDRKDDPTKTARDTASADMLKAAADMRRARNDASAQDEPKLA